MPTYERDRRRIAYLFAVTMSGIAIYCATTRALDYGAFLVLGGFATSVWVLLGIKVDPRRFYDDPDRNRRRLPRESDEGDGGGTMGPLARTYHQWVAARRGGDRVPVRRLRDLRGRRYVPS